MSATISLPNYSAYPVLVSDECNQTGSGDCDGHDYESNDSCDCPCHEADSLPPTMDGVAQWHITMHKTGGSNA